MASETHGWSGSICFCGAPMGAGHTHDVTEVEWLRARLAEAERLLRLAVPGLAAPSEASWYAALARWLEGGGR